MGSGTISAIHGTEGAETSVKKVIDCFSKIDINTVLLKGT
jgi:hypothetical protein